MCLVHRQQRKLGASGKGEKAIGRQALRRDVDDLVGAALRTAQHLQILRVRQGRVDVRRSDARLFERRHLILH